MDRYTVDENSYYDIEEWAAQLISGADLGWLKPTKIIKDRFETWKMNSFITEKETSKKDTDPKLEFEKLDKKIRELFSELDKDYFKNDVYDAYYRLAVLLGKIKYIKSLNIDWGRTIENTENVFGQSKVDGIKKFEHYLYPRGLLILPELIKRYSGKQPKELALMVLALLRRGLIKSTIKENFASLNKMLSDTFSGNGVPYALSKNFDKYFTKESTLSDYDKDEKESHDKIVDELLSKLPTP